MLNAKPLNARNQISRAILDQCPPIFHCHAPLKSYPSCPPAHWDASPTAVSLVAPDPGRNFQMWHLSSFPGSQRPNREWLFWPSASSTMDFGYNMMATQLIVADHEGYRIVHVKMFRPRNQFWCFGMIFWGHFAEKSCHQTQKLITWGAWGGPVTKMTRSFSIIRLTLASGYPRQKAANMVDSAQVVVKVLKLWRLEKMPTLVVEARSTTLAVSVLKWYRQIRRKWCGLASYIRYEVQVWISGCSKQDWKHQQ